MKKYFIVGLFLVMAFTAKSQKWELNASEYAYKVMSYGSWTDWTDWIDCNVRITVSPQFIKIYSDSPQFYRVVGFKGKSVNTWKWYCCNAQGIYCNIRFKIDSEGEEQNQLYVDFSDAKWVYNVSM